MRDKLPNKPDPKNNDNLYNLKEFTIKLDTGFIYYLLGFLKAHKNDEIINALYWHILKQLNNQNERQKL